MIRRNELTVVATLALVSIAVLLALPRAAAPGLTGRYWDVADWYGRPVVDVSAATPSTTDIARSLRQRAGGPASAEWTGFLIVERAGTFEFALRSTGSAAVFVNGRTVATTEGGVGSLSQPGMVVLSSGAHPLRVRYSGAVPPHELSVLWMPRGQRADILRPEHLSSTRPSSARIRFGRAIRFAGVAVPLVWAGLVLYLPLRLAGSWMWRAVRRVTPQARDRAALVAVLVVATGLAVWGMEWGLTGDDWAPDELRPGIVRDALTQRFAGGWHDKYPAMHYLVLGLPLSAFELAEGVPALTANPLHAFVAQFVIVRLISTLLGAGALIALYLCAVELYGSRHAVLAPLVLAVTPLYAFYGKLANLDIPALCWFGWAVLGFIRIERRGDRGDYLLLGTAAAAAVATKDQSYASLALLAPAAFWFTVSRQPHRTWWPRLIGALTDRRLLGGVAATIGASLVFHNVLVNPTGFREHMRVLSEFNDIAVVPRTLAGAAELTWRTIDLWRLSLGLPFFALAIWGLWTAWTRPERRRWLWLLLVPLSFHLTFTWVTFFVCDRYLFSGLFVLALFAGATLGDLMESGRPAALTLAVAALGVSVPYAASINVMMNLDARRAVRAWVQDRAPGDELVGLVGRYVPYIPPPLRAAAIESPADADTTRPDFIIVNARYAVRFQRMRSPAGRDLIAHLRDGRLGYREVLSFRARLPFWALLQYEPSFAPGGEAWWTNLDKVNPEMQVFQRR